MEIGTRLRELRCQAGMSGNALAHLAGVAQSTISGVESGRVTPSIRVLDKLCRAMGITLGDFFSRSPGREPLPPPLQALVSSARQLDDKELQTLNLLVVAMLQQKKSLTGFPVAAENRTAYTTDDKQKE